MGAFSLPFSNIVSLTTKNIHSMSKPTVVFTGSLVNTARKDAIRHAEVAGFTPREVLTRDTTYLVCGASPGSNVTNARSWGVKVVNESEWEKILKQAGSGAGSGSVSSGGSTTPKKRRNSADDSEDEDDEDAASKAKKLKLPACIYGLKCYRKNSDHLKKFYHPPKPKATSSKAVASSSAVADADPDEEEKEEEEEAESSTSKKPSLSRQFSKDILAVDGDIDIAVEDPSQPGPSASTRVTDANRGSDSDNNEDNEDNEDNDDENENENDFDAKTAAINSVHPKKLLADGESISVTSTSSTAQWTVKRTGTSYTCTCPAWRNQNQSPSFRSCKHTREVLGEEYERERVGKMAWVSGSGIATSDPSKVKNRAIGKHSAPALLLAHKWTDAHDPVGWWISEKLDGVRAFWDCKKKVFLSRLGNEYQAPAWFTQGLPNDQDLDGELFGGRSRFKDTVSIVKTPGSANWKQITYQVFDIPSKKLNFEERMEAIKKIFDTNKPPFARIVKHTECLSVQHLTDTLAAIEAKGGEGVMIRQPKSQYVNGRSNTLLKVKTFLDGEAVVIAHEPGKGSLQGMTGALKAQMACGKIFRVGSGMSAKERRNPPKIGSIIVYKCQELSAGGHPRFPIYLGVAPDKKKPTDPDMTSKGGASSANKPTGHDDD